MLQYILPMQYMYTVYCNVQGTLHLYCFNPGVDNVPKMEHTFQILSDSWLCWVNLVLINSKSWVYTTCQSAKVHTV